MQDPNVQEENGRQRLVLRGRANLQIDGKMGQEHTDLGLAQPEQISMAVKLLEPAEPSQVGLDGETAVVASA